MGSAQTTGTDRTRSLLIAAWIVVYSNGLLIFVARRSLDLPGTWEGPILRPAIILSTLIGVGIVVLDGQRLDGARLRPVPALPFATAAALGAWAALGSLWSLDAEVSLWWGLVYIGLPCVAWVIADATPGAFLRGLSLGTGFLLAFSFVLLVVKTSWAVDFNDDWKGVMTNRNGFAPICALAVFAGVAHLVRRRVLVGALLVVPGLVGLAGSGSRTAWLAFALGGATATVLVLARRAYLADPRPWIPRVTALVFGAGAVGATVGVAALWNDPTFGQRRTIWRLVGDHIADAPIVGNGFAAFWRVPELHTDELLQRGSAHGSVPELLLGTGLIGLALWAVVVGVALIGVGRAVWRDPGVESWLWAAVVAMLFVENLTESFVLWFSYNWILLIAAALRFGLRRDGRRLTTPDRALVSVD
ncbi:MAG: O-antigen ligase family protein [Actinomycetota bacterium]